MDLCLQFDISGGWRYRGTQLSEEYEGHEKQGAAGQRKQQKRKAK